MLNIALYARRWASFRMYFSGEYNINFNNGCKYLYSCPMADPRPSHPGAEKRSPLVDSSNRDKIDFCWKVDKSNGSSWRSLKASKEHLKNVIGNVL